MRARVSAISIALLLMAVVATPVSAAPRAGQWHRLNVDPANASAEHERITCFESSSHWACFYDKVQDPGYQWNATVGVFVGRAVTRGWVCPAWFPGEICDNVVAVYSGRASYFPEAGEPFSVAEQYVVTSRDGQAVLEQYWVDQFVCPWFRTFDEAVAANPERQMDCVFAP